MPASLRTMLSENKALSSPTVSSDTDALKPLRCVPSSTARVLRYQHRNATRAASDTTRSAIFANPHDTHIPNACPLPAKFSISDCSPVVLPAQSGSTAEYSKLDDGLFAVTTGPSLTMEPQRVLCKLLPSRCRALTSIASSSTNGMTWLTLAFQDRRDRSREYRHGSNLPFRGYYSPGGYRICGLPGPSRQPRPVFLPGFILDKAQ